MQFPNDIFSYGSTFPPQYVDQAAALQNKESAELLEDAFNRLFEKEKNEVLELAEKLILQKNSNELPDFSLLIELLAKILDSEEPEDLRSEAIHAIAEHPLFPNVLNAMISSHPWHFMRAASLLNKNILLESFSIVIEQEAANGYFGLAQCVNQLLDSDFYDLEVCPKLLDSVLMPFSQEQILSFTEELIAFSSAESLGKLFSLAKTKHAATSFALALINSYEDTGETIEFFAEIINTIAAVQEEEEEKFKPQVLLEFIKEDDGESICETLLKNKELLTVPSFLFILWCLSSRQLKDHLSEYKIEEDCDTLIDYLEGLLTLENRVEKQILLTKTFVKELSEDEFFHFLTMLIIKDSKSIPYLSPALEEAAFQTFALVLDPSLRTNLLRKGLALTLPENCKIVKTLCRQNKKETLLNLSVMDIVSQNLISVGESQFGKMAALCDIRDYIARGVEEGSLEDRMTKLQDDFIKIPPLLIALSMRDEAFRPHFMKTIRYMTDEQLTAFSGQVPSDNQIDILDQMMDIARLDQMEKILKEIALEQLETYICTKGERIKENFTSLILRQEEIKEGIDHLKVLNPIPYDDYKKTSELCEEQYGALQFFLEAKMQVLFKFAQLLLEGFDIEKEELLREMFWIHKQINKINQELKGNGGFFNFLNQIDPEKQAETNVYELNLESIPLSLKDKYNISKDFLKRVGLIYEEDIRCLGITDDSVYQEKLLSYLHQSESLESIWQFFRSKNFGSVLDLFKAMVTESPEDLIKLKDLALKMGWNQEEK